MVKEARGVSSQFHKLHPLNQTSMSFIECSFLTEDLVDFR